MTPFLENLCTGLIVLSIIAFLFGLYCIRTAVRIDEKGNVVKKDGK